MSKFCGNCGAQSDDNAMVCGNCGTPFAPVQTPVQPVNNLMPDTPDMNQNIPGVSGNTSKIGGALAFLDPVAAKIGLAPDLFKKILAGVLAAIILIVGISAISGGSGYKGVVKDFAKAVETGNGKKLAKKLYKDAVIDEEDIMEFFDEINEELCEEFDSKKIKTSYKITEEREISKSDMEDEFDVRKTGHAVFFDLTVKAGGDEETYEGAILFIKDGGLKIMSYRFLGY